MAAAVVSGAAALLLEAESGADASRHETGAAGDEFTGGRGRLD